MFHWIRDNIGTKTLLVFGIVVVVIVGAFTGPTLYKSIKRAGYEGEAMAQVLNVVEKKASAQHYSGINTKTIGFDVTYSYSVEGMSISNTEALKPSAESRKLFEAFTSGRSCNVAIKYSRKNHASSYLIELIEEIPGAYD